MTNEPERDGESRWEELVLAESCGEITAFERLELERLAARSEARRNEREALSAIASLVPSVGEIPNEERRLIQSVLAQYRKRANRRRTSARGIGVAVMLIPFAAAAQYWVDRHRGSESVSSSPSSPVVPAQPTTRRASLATPPTKEAGSGPVISRDAAAPVASHASSAPPPPSAAELLSRAQQARSVRNYAGAVKLYRDLARVYPKSAEAHLSRISLAQLELAQENPRQALAGFEAYERLGGPLLQEAEYGKIQALGALGRTEQERAEIRRFLARHPKSLQAAALRRRLGAAGATE